MDPDPETTVRDKLGNKRVNTGSTTKAVWTDPDDEIT